MDSTGADPSMRKRAQEGAQLVGMDPTGGEPSMRKQAEEGALLVGMDSTGGEPSTWELANKKAAIMLGMVSTGVQPSMRKQAEEESEEAASMRKKAQKKWDLVWNEAMEKVYQARIAREASLKEWRMAPRETAEARMKREKARANAKAKIEREMAQARIGKAMLTPKEKAQFDRMHERAKAKAKAKEEEPGKDEVSATEAGIAEEAAMVGSSKSDDEVMGKETLQQQQLLKDTSNRFAMLDPDGDDEKDEMIDRGKSAIEGEHMPSDGINPHDKGEVSVAVGSSKSVMDQEVMGLEAEESVTEAGMTSAMQRHAEEPTGPVEFVGNYYSPEFWDQLTEHQEAPCMAEAWGPEEPMTEMDVVGIGKLAMEEHLSMVDFEFKLEMDAEAGESEEDVSVRGYKSFLDMDAEVIAPETGKDTLQQLLPKGMSNRFDILDHGGHDEKCETDRGKSFVQEHMPMLDVEFKSEMTMVKSDKLLLPVPADPSATESIQYHDLDPMWKEAEEGALLVGVDSTGGGPSMRKEESGQRSEMVEISQMVRHIALLGIKEKCAKKEAALLAGMYSTGGESSMRKQAEESREKSEMQWQAEEDVMDYFSILPPERGARAIKQYYAMKYEAAEWKALVAKQEKWKALLASQEKSARRAKAKARARAKAKAKAKEEAGRPEEPVTEAGKAEKAVTEEVHFPKGMQRALLDIREKWAKKKNNNLDKETLRQLVKDLSDKFDISMRSTSAIEEHTPMVESDKLLLQPANPSATNSMTILGVQDDLHHDRGKSSATTLANKMADEEMEAKNFDEYRRYWESAWSETLGSFKDMTALSSMQFTCCTPGPNFPCNVDATNPATLQIFYIKLAQVNGGLQWPLSVYGVVAVRDVVDHNRNFIFSCYRDESQQLTQDDPYLRLIGPSRAVVYSEKVNFEIKLKVKGATASQDKALITQARGYHEAFGDGVSTVCFENCFCTLELCVQVVRQTIQATILGVQVARGRRWPFKYGARVTCYSVPGKWEVTGSNRVTCVTSPPSGQFVMLDSEDGAKLKGCDGYLHLPRNVISVEIQGRLDVSILAYSKSGEIAAQEFVRFYPKVSKISQENCSVSGVPVLITVAWSLVPTDKSTFMALGRLACS